MRKTNSSKIACIGAGYWGKNLVRNFSGLGVLAAICESSAERRAQLEKEYPSARVTDSVDQILADPEVVGVAIATPAETHGELVHRALMAGKDVLVEKPLCLSVQEGEELVALANQKNRLLMVGHLLWYHPAIVKLKELIHEGELGRIQYIYSNRLNLGKIRQEENILWSFAPHDVSVILGLLGETPNLIQAQGGNYLHQQIADVTVSLLSFPSGKRAHIFVSWLHPFKEQKLIVVGDRKMAVFDDMEKKDKLLLFPHTIDWKNHIPVPNRAEAQPVHFEVEEPLRAECLHFMECIETRNRPRTDGEEGLRVLKVLQQCQEALEQKQTHPPLTLNGLRKTDAEKTASPPYFAHASAFLDEEIQIGEGTSIWHVSHILKGSRIGNNCKIGQNVVVGPKATIGNGVKIQNNVSVYEGVTLEDDVFCGPSMVFTNVFNPRSKIPRMHDLKSTLVKQGATLGANTTIVCGVTIGRHAFIGAGAVVTRDVPDYALVVGNPARLTGWMCHCGVKLKFNGSGSKCTDCGAEYQKNEKGIERIEKETVNESSIA